MIAITGTVSLMADTLYTLAPSATAAGSSCATTLIDLPAFFLNEREILSVFSIGDGENFPLQAVFFMEQRML